MQKYIKTFEDLSLDLDPENFPFKNVDAYERHWTFEHLKSIHKKQQETSEYLEDLAIEIPNKTETLNRIANLIKEANSLLQEVITENGN